MPKSTQKTNQSIKEKEEDQTFIGEEDDKRLVIQMHFPMWSKLRRLAFDMNISMAELCRQGITMLLEQHEKPSRKQK